MEPAGGKGRSQRRHRLWLWILGIAAFLVLIALGGCVRFDRGTGPSAAQMPTPEEVADYARNKWRGYGQLEYVGEVRAGGPDNAVPKGSYPVVGLYNTAVPEGFLGYEYADRDRRFVLYPCKITGPWVRDASTFVNITYEVWLPGWHVISGSAMKNTIPKGISQ